MTRIHSSTYETADEFGAPGNYVAGANILGFVKVAQAMVSLGLIRAARQPPPASLYSTGRKGSVSRANSRRLIVDSRCRIVARNSRAPPIPENASKPRCRK